jgi:enoyl-CoA hydratase
LNALIHEYPKPYVALINGIVMGGGVGVSILGSHRVVAENVTFSMPEVGIGFYPDVGATYFLPRLPGRSGTWLALTGARIGAADCLALGLATHHVPAAKFDNVIAALAEGGHVETVLAWHGMEAGTAPVTANRAAIDRLFSGASVEAILAALDAETGAAAGFAQDAAAAIRTKSPTSLKIAQEQMRRGGAFDFREAMRTEFRLASRILDRPDMVEGVRAVVVDKDNAPRWQPSRLADVTEAAVQAMFAPLGEQELMFT